MPQFRFELKCVPLRSADWFEQQGDKVRLPPAALQPVLSSNSKHIRISTSKGTSSSFCGILDFSAAPGTVELPERVMDSLSISSPLTSRHQASLAAEGMTQSIPRSSTAVIRSISLQKASLLVLRPLTADFNDIPDAGACLEQVLGKAFATASRGSIIKIRHGGEVFDVLIEQVRVARTQSAGSASLSAAATDGPVGVEATGASLLDADVSIDIKSAMNEGSCDGRQPTTKLAVCVSPGLGPTAEQSSSYTASGKQARSSGAAAGPGHWQDLGWTEFEAPVNAYSRFAFYPPAWLGSSSESAAAGSMHGSSGRALAARAGQAAAGKQSSTPLSSLQLPAGWSEDGAPRFRIEAEILRGESSMPAMSSAAGGSGASSSSRGGSRPCPSLFVSCGEACPRPSLLSHEQASIDAIQLASVEFDARTPSKDADRDGQHGRSQSRLPMALPPAPTHLLGTAGQRHFVSVRADASSEDGSEKHSARKGQRTVRMRIRVSLHAAAKHGLRVGGGGGSAAGAADADSSVCSNCGGSVPKHRMVMHEAYCRRHLRKCKECGELLRAGSEEARLHGHCELCGQQVRDDEAGRRRHNTAWHSPIQCGCGASAKDYAGLRTHRNTKMGDCPMRLQQCRFCNDIVEMGTPPSDPVDVRHGLSGHEARCGNRTEICPGCSRRYRLKDYPEHFALSERCRIVADTGALAAAGASAAPSPAPSRVRDTEKACSNCTYKNAPGATACAMCGTSIGTTARAAAMRYRFGGQTGTRSAASNGSGGGGQIALARRRCRNQACAHFVDGSRRRRAESGPGSGSGSDSDEGTSRHDWELCTDCFDRIVDPVSDDVMLEPDASASVGALSRHLVRLYSTQLRRGCGQPGCSNVACASGSKLAASKKRSGASGAAQSRQD